MKTQRNLFYVFFGNRKLDSIGMLTYNATVLFPQITQIFSQIYADLKAHCTKRFNTLTSLPAGRQVHKKQLHNMKSPETIVAHMMENDLFSQWLGVEVLEVKEGYSRIQMKVRPEMINGFGIVHGGIAFSLADSAFAFACNNRNNLSVALDTSINFLKPVHVGDELIAEAKELHNGRSTGLYHIEVSNQHQHRVAVFKGTCYRTQKPLVKD